MNRSSTGSTCATGSLGRRSHPSWCSAFPTLPKHRTACACWHPSVALVADCFASLIWRVDVQPGGRDIQARVWLEHESMEYFPGKLKPEQPGVNAVRYAARTNHLYYTSTAKKLLMRVPVSPNTLDPVGAPELGVAGRMFDDFCIDEEAAVLYLTTHRQNTIDRVSMDPGENSGFTQSVAGDPFTEAMIGPSSGAWSRQSGEYGKAAYFICDGGTASPPPGGSTAREAALGDLLASPNYAASHGPLNLDVPQTRVCGTIAAPPE